MIESSRLQQPTPTADAGPDLRVVRPEAPAVVIRAEPAPEESDWVLDGNRRRAEAVLARLEAAVHAGRRRRADRLRREFLRVVQQDRTAAACLAARDEGLRLEPVGHGDLLDVPTLYRLRRTPWDVRPMPRGPDGTLPDHARSAKDAWERRGRLFDALYRATEAPEVLDGPDTPRPRRSFLIGVISADGTTGDWFVLDDWREAG